MRCVLVAITATLVAGCTAPSWRDQVRRQAARDAHCALDEVRITGTKGEPPRRGVRLEVCGRTRHYREVRSRERPGETVWRLRRPRRRRRARRAERRRPYALAVRRVIEGSMPEFRRCLDAVEDRHAPLEGAVVVRFTVGRDGAVRQTWTVSNELPLVVGVCLERRLRRQRFPRPPRGEVTLHYPFLFE